MGYTKSLSVDAELSRLKIEQNVNLKSFNSLGVQSSAEYFCAVSSHEDILEARAFATDQKLPIHILGGGSNLVLKEKLPGLTLHVSMLGRSISGNFMTLEGGENWHEGVGYAIEHHRYGIENLALIPGLVGAAPIQNIGAYGVELSEVLATVSGVELHSGESFEFDKNACEFGYRDSIFKRKQRDQFLITRVSLELDSTYQPRLEYAGLVDSLGDREPTAANVSDAVVRLRQSKLPDPALVGNVGSFFKNPVVSRTQFQELKLRKPEISGFVQDDTVKLSAAWLIDQCKLKGRTKGGARVSHQHALVIENGGHATGADVLALAAEVQANVEERFNIQLEVEPRVLP